MAGVIRVQSNAWLKLKAGKSCGKIVDLGWVWCVGWKNLHISNHQILIYRPWWFWVFQKWGSVFRAPWTRPAYAWHYCAQFLCKHKKRLIATNFYNYSINTRSPTWKVWGFKGTWYKKLVTWRQFCYFKTLNRRTPSDYLNHFLWFNFIYKLICYAIVETTPQLLNQGLRFFKMRFLQAQDTPHHHPALTKLKAVLEFLKSTFVASRTTFSSRGSSIGKNLLFPQKTQIHMKKHR